MQKLFFHIGRYYLLLKKIFRKPEQWHVFRNRFTDEAQLLGVNSIGLVLILSVFMGAVITLQTAANIDSPLIPAYVVGYTARQSMVLEFSPTIIALILSGKVGSNIASEIGTMRVTEQIDALDIMGVNSASYLVLPKIAAALFIFPFIILMSMAVGMLGGWLVSIGAGLVSHDEYLYGIMYDFKPFTISYAMIKTVVFAFIITSVSSYHGYHTNGGALEVGRSSTKAVVYASILILLTNYAITQLILI